MQILEEIRCNLSSKLKSYLMTISPYQKCRKAKHSNETLHESDDQAWSEDYESEDENNRSDI